jgi:hypothetical protein
VHAAPEASASAFKYSSSKPTAVGTGCLLPVHPFSWPNRVLALLEFSRAVHLYLLLLLLLLQARTCASLMLACMWCQAPRAA